MCKGVGLACRLAEARPLFFLFVSIATCAGGCFVSSFPNLSSCPTLNFYTCLIERSPHFLQACVAREPVRSGQRRPSVSKSKPFQPTCFPLFSPLEPLKFHCPTKLFQPIAKPPWPESKYFQTIGVYLHLSAVPTSRVESLVCGCPAPALVSRSGAQCCHVASAVRLLLLEYQSAKCHHRCRDSYCTHTNAQVSAIGLKQNGSWS